MIVGNGMIAKAFSDIENCIILASGVSDSCTSNIYEFKREEELIYKTLRINKKAVYFSSISNSGTPYINHKRNMERIVLEYGNSIVIKTSQVVGNGGNQNNLFRKLHNEILICKVNI